MRRRSVFLLPALVTFLLLACGARVSEDHGTAPRQAGPQVVFPSVVVDVELARTDAERAKGLGGHAPLGPREGMLFVFERPDRHGFWMKGMTFPLDIMWIRDGQVVHVERNVPPPAPGMTDRELPVYQPSVPSTMVLEVNAGFTRQHGIASGTPVQFRGF